MQSAAGLRRSGDLARSSLPGLIILYASLYGAYGMESPFLPAFFGSRGLGAGEIGFVLAAGTAVRLLAGPVFGALSDRLDATKRILGLNATAAGLLGLVYLVGVGFWSLLAASMLHAVVTAPLAPLADALALASSRREKVFAYGWVRGVGSATFVAATLVSGQIVAAFGVGSIVLGSSIGFLLMPLSLGLIKPSVGRVVGEARDARLRELIAIPLFRNLLLIAALVIGSHAMNEAFAVIRWRAAGISPQVVSLLWSASVVSEVAVFLVFGKLLLDRLGPGGGAALAAAAGAIRWAVMARTTALVGLFPAQLLHGLTFALMHLVAMRVIGDVIPEKLSARALTVYGTLALGIVSIILTLASGTLYGSYGGRAFWLMSALCLVALALSPTLRGSHGRPDEAKPPDILVSLASHPDR